MSTYSATVYESDLEQYDNKLRFPPALEVEYRTHYYHKSIRTTRIYFVGAGIAWSLFSLLDYYAMPTTYLIAWALRSLILLGLMAAMGVSFLPSFKNWMSEILLVLTFFSGLMIVAMIAVAYPFELAYTFYPFGILLVMVVMYVVHAPLHKIMLSNGLLTLAYIIVGIFDQRLLEGTISTQRFFVTTFFLIGMNWVTATLGYFLEISNRKDFLQQRIIEQQRVEAEFLREQADSLLLNIMPKEIASILKQNQHNIIADYYDEASILFADIVDFTPLSVTLTPTELVELLDEIFSHFDEIVEKYNLEKIKTIGDCYMVAAGIPRPRADHAYAITSLALDMHDCIRRQLFHGEQVSFRIGINSGPVVAGVIGKKKFAYDLWGDAVNTASRMESHGIDGSVQITKATYELIKDDFICEDRGVIQVKGKGEMKVWHVVAKKPIATTEDGGL